jgi:hypothetical protein
MEKDAHYQELIKQQRLRSRMSFEVEQEEFTSKLEPNERIYLLGLVNDVDDAVKRSNKLMTGYVDFHIYYNGRVILPESYFHE